jgi:hypothetical protein
MADSPDCWVEFWERQEYEGGYLKFSGPMDCPNMGIYDLNNPDGIDKGLNNQVDSLKTGSKTWMELYRGKDYQDTFLMVPPNSSYDNLDDFGLGDKSNSFILYDARPVSWPASQKDNDAPSTCWVKLYNGRRFDSIPTRLNGPGEASNYRTPYGSVGSLTIGPDTWIELYPETGFKGDPVCLGPNTLVANLYDAYQISVIDSMNVYSVEPDDWSATPPKSASNGVILGIQAADANSRVEALVAGVAGMVPTVGSGLKGLVTALWPNPTDPMAVWDAIDQYINTLVQGLLNQAKADYLQSTLQGIYNLILNYNATAYGTTQKGSLFSSLLSQVLADEPYFMDREAPETTLTYLVSMGTVTLIILREQALFYQDIYNEADPTPEEHLALLQGKISEYGTCALSASKNAIEWRLGLIEVKSTSGGPSPTWAVVDAYTNYNSAAYSSEASAEAMKRTVQEQVARDYAMQLETIMNPAKLWKYLDPAVTERPTVEVYQVVSNMYGRPSGTAFSDTPGDKKITGLYLYSGNLVDGLQIYYGGEPGPMHGSKSGANQKLYTFETDELIVAAYGGAGSALDQILFRTNLGRDFGNGGSGGSLWTASAPQGVGAALVKISGYQSESAIEAIQFTWEYQRFV